VRGATAAESMDKEGEGTADPPVFGHGVRRLGGDSVGRAAGRNLRRALGMDIGTDIFSGRATRYEAKPTWRSTSGRRSASHSSQRVQCVTPTGKAAWFGPGCPGMPGLRVASFATNVELVDDPDEVPGRGSAIERAVDAGHCDTTVLERSEEAGPLMGHRISMGDSGRVPEHCESQRDRVMNADIYGRIWPGPPMGERKALPGGSSGGK
jgi:hypothetical protein